MAFIWVSKKDWPKDSILLAKSPPLGESGGKLAFWLVVIMLGILLVLTAGLLWFPVEHTTTDATGHKVTVIDKELLEYYKWSLSALLGAFGAWIGAGAAYFFGKENLRESSRSTEAALKIQQEGLRAPPRPERLRTRAGTT
jgi:hypothetical protein